MLFCKRNVLFFVFLATITEPCQAQVVTAEVRSSSSQEEACGFVSSPAARTECVKAINRGSGRQPDAYPAPVVRTLERRTYVANRHRASTTPQPVGTEDVCGFVSSPAARTECLNARRERGDDRTQREVTCKNLGLRPNTADYAECVSGVVTITQVQPDTPPSTATGNRKRRAHSAVPQAPQHANAEDGCVGATPEQGAYFVCDQEQGTITQSRPAARHANASGRKRRTSPASPPPGAVALSPNQQTCSGYGFRRGTDKFAQCVMQLDQSQIQAQALAQAQAQQYALQQQQIAEQAAREKERRDRAQQAAILGALGGLLGGGASPAQAFSKCGTTGGNAIIVQGSSCPYGTFYIGPG